MSRRQFDSSRIQLVSGPKSAVSTCQTVYLMPRTTRSGYFQYKIVLVFMGLVILTHEVFDTFAACPPDPWLSYKDPLECSSGEPRFRLDNDCATHPPGPSRKH